MELVNPVPVDEVEPWLAALVTTLLGAPWDDDFAKRVERWRGDWLADQTWGVRDHGRWVATMATEPLGLTVPGIGAATTDLLADAVTAVTVAATHRRRGLLRQMITQSLQLAVDRGHAVSMLLAAEWPIYGRFGYAPATRSAEYTFHSRWAGAALTPAPSGTVRQVDRQQLGEHASSIFGRARRRTAGQVDRPGEWWPRRLGLNNYEPISSQQATWILHETDGEPDGLIGWRVTKDFEPTGDYGEIEVAEFHAASDPAYRNLWAYLASLDVIDTVKLRERPIDEPVRWLLPDGRALTQTYCGDDLWVRLLDVPAALSARGYATPGRIVLEVVDDALGGYTTGRYLLDVEDGGATCTRTTESADLRLPQRMLASTYLGDHSLRAVSIAGGLDELTPDAVTRADAMFATARRPWNTTGF